MGSTTGRGTVRSFDETGGLGEIAGVDGSIRPFHCVEIADGSRHIDIGVEVDYRLVPKLGRWEAADIRRVPTGSR